jgi:MFS family permease
MSTVGCRCVIEAVPAPRLTNPWVVLLSLLLIYIFNFADRYLITGLVGPIKDEFGVGDGYMGLLMGPAFVLLYVVMGVPIARFADRSSRVRIIAAGCVFWSLSTMLTGLAVGPATLALARVGVGIGEAAFVAPAYSLLSDYFKPERRGLAFAILGLATYFGQIAGQGGGPALASATSWREAFFVMGAPGIAFGVLALILIREPVRSAPVTVHTQEAFLALIKRLIATPTYVLLILTLGLGSLSGVAFGYWGPELFARSYGLDPVAAKSAFALNFGGAGLVGILIFGPVADRLSKRRKDAPLRLSAGALFAATSFILAVTWVPDFRTAKLSG